MTSLHLGSRSLSFAYIGSTPKIQSVSGSEPASVSYDNAGNDVTAMSYSARNLLSFESDPGQMPDRGQMSYLAYSYDGRGVRVRTSWKAPGPFAQTRRSLYSPELHLLAQSDWTSGSTLGGFFFGTDYVWFADQPVAQTFNDLSQPTRYTFTDHLGTPILQTDPTRAVVWQAEYEPYGTIYTYQVGDADDAQALRFPGQEASESRLINGSDTEYNIFRWYRPGWGRYTQGDPLEFKGGINLFAYALENPLRYKDPLGLKVYRCCAPADVVGGMVNHCWIKTDKQQTQIGFADEGQPAGNDPGGACASPFFSQAQVQIYKGNKKGTNCTEITDVD